MRTDDELISDVIRDAQDYAQSLYIGRGKTGAKNALEISRKNLVARIQELENKLSQRILELQYANTVCIEQKHHIQELDQAQRWIPCSERLPEEKGEYLCCLKPHIFVTFFGDSWDGTLGFRSVIAPTHWKPLPPAPMDEEKE